MSRFIVVVALAWLSLALTAAARAAEPVPIQDARSLLADVARWSGATTRRESSAQLDLNKNGDARTIQPGETLVLGDLTGPGAITHIWNTIGSRDPFIGRAVVLRIYWDGADKPSVQAPLGDFFGVGHGAQATYESLPVAVNSFGRSRSCFWRMPFARSAKVTASNESAEPITFYYYLDWEQLAEPPVDPLYFHAEYRQAMPAAAGDYTLLETTGRGNYVGTVYSAQQVCLGWFGEGDDRFYIDGESEPRLRGTGTEDYFNDAWGFRAYASPYFGVSLWEGYFPGDRSTAYRWHLPDPVRFERSLRVSIEHRGSVFSPAGMQKATFAERRDWLSSVAFWYQTPPRGIEASLPAAKDRIAPYRVLKAAAMRAKAKPSLVLTKDETAVTYVPGRADAEIEFTFDVAEKGTYQVSALLMYSVFGSRYQPALDDQEIGPELDLCYPGMDAVWVSFDLRDLDAGAHRLAFQGRGPSPKARSKTPKYYGFGLQNLVLLRLQDMAGYGD